jgi:hypothetical protein
VVLGVILSEAKNLSELQQEEEGFFGPHSGPQNDKPLEGAAIRPWGGNQFIEVVGMA